MEVYNMNCNSNTMALNTISQNGACTGKCQNRYIYIMCRTIVIPVGQEIIAVQTDNNSIERTFVFPTVNESGDDLTDKTFTVISKNEKF